MSLIITARAPSSAARVAAAKPIPAPAAAVISTDFARQQVVAGDVGWWFFQCHKLIPLMIFRAQP